ncbi:hypothetical protein KBA39_00045 [Myxococcota bacterium]|nr:hypothetical protein [Myxococcota bacterium]
MKKILFVTVAVLAFAVACDNDNDAMDRGVGEACVVTSDCRNDDLNYEDDVVEPLELLECLTEFKGGYCGLKGCQDHADCPEGSKCVVGETDNYCFLVCVDKPDCNKYRSVDNEANCSGSAELIDGAKEIKVCVPPSGDTAA